MQVANKCGWVDCNCDSVTLVYNTITSTRFNHGILPSHQRNVTQQTSVLRFSLNGTMSQTDVTLCSYIML